MPPAPTTPDPKRVPMRFGDGPRPILMLHGLTGAPWDLEPLARALAERGYSVHLPLLAGHGDLDALEESRWPDWYDSARSALQALRSASDRPCAVLGFSMGGLLALRLAALESQSIAALAVLSVPLRIPPHLRLAAEAMAHARDLPLLGRLVGHRWKKRIDVRVQSAAELSPGLRAFPYRSLAELAALQDDVRERLDTIASPMLLLHGRYDHAAALDDSARVSQRVASPILKRVVLPRSYHLLTRDLDATEVEGEVLNFFDPLLPP